MLLKRLYDKPAGWEPEKDADGALLNPLPVVGLSIKHTGTSAEQNFSRRFVEGGLAAGWLSMGHGLLTLHAEEGDLQYTMLRPPGTYCCHCGTQLDDDPSGESGRRHLARVHEGEPSPDPSNPMGFRVSNAYECRLDDAQHAQWNAQAFTARMAGEAPAPVRRRAAGSRSAPSTNGNHTSDSEKEHA